MLRKARVRAGARTAATVWTLGHSTRPIGEMLAVLRAHGITQVADVRRFPGSRRQPQYGSAAFARSLARAGIAYLWLPALGGRRRPSPASPNQGWRHPAFRGYADHLDTDEFSAGLLELLMAAQAQPTALMCAERLWWRCHRRLIADVLVALGLQVVHIRDAAAAEPHRLAPPARLRRGRLTYPATAETARRPV